jgi:guanine deaminase
LLRAANHGAIEEAANMLFGMMMVGDDRCVDETWVMGKRPTRSGQPRR